MKREENELLTRVGPGTPMGNLFRQYWIPALTSDDLTEPAGDPMREAGSSIGEETVSKRRTSVLKVR